MSCDVPCDYIYMPFHHPRNKRKRKEKKSNQRKYIKRKENQNQNQEFKCTIIDKYYLRS